MLVDVLHLLGDRVLVDRNRNAAGRLDRRHRPIQPRPIVAADHDLIAGLDTERLQPTGQGADLGRDFSPSPALPNTETLLAGRRTVTANFGIVNE